jgi:hypothetical protein
MTKPGDVDHRVDEHVDAVLARSADGQLAMGAVHRVARLEGDDTAPCQLLELGAQLGGGVCQCMSLGFRSESGILTTQTNVVEVSRRLDRLDLAANVEVLHSVAKVGNGRVCGVVCTANFGRFFDLVRPVDILDCTVSAKVYP